MKTSSKKLFFNKGFGWVCVNCEKAGKASKKESDGEVARLMREGEAESKTPRFSNTSMAAWSDQNKASLTCPNCENTDKV